MTSSYPKPARGREKKMIPIIQSVAATQLHGVPLDSQSIDIRDKASALVDTTSGRFIPNF